MPVRFATLLATCLLALALPAAALGQGAGDEQYSDPFGNEQTQGGGDSGSSGGDDGAGDDHGPPPGGSGDDTPTSSDDTGTAGDTTTGSSGTSGTPAPSPGAEAGSSGAGSGQAGELPYTGAEEGLIALAGALLLAGGVALRLRLRDQR